MKLKVGGDMAIAVIYFLIMNIRNKDILPHNHMEIFDWKKKFGRRIRWQKY